MDKRTRNIVVASIVIVATLLVAMLATVIYRYYSSPEGVYAEIKSIALENGYATATDFSNCDNNYTSSCNAEAAFYTTNGIKADFVNSNVSNKPLFASLQRYNEEFTSYTAREALGKLKWLVREKERLLLPQDTDLDSIKNVLLRDEFKDYQLSSYNLSGNWAGTTLHSPTTEDCDDVLVLLRKDSSGWKTVLGPGTSFDESDFYSLGEKPSTPYDTSEPKSENVVPDAIISYFLYGNTSQNDIY